MALRGSDCLYFHDLRFSNLALSSSLSIRPGLSLSERRSLFISYQTKQGDILYGECPPLPGVHEESFEQAAALLQADCQQALPEIRLDWSQNINWSQPYFGLINGPAMPSVKFAMEQILWQAIFWYFPDSPYYQQIPQSLQTELAGLVHFQKQARERAPAEVYKLKIGRQDFDSDLQSISQFLQDKTCRLRLDANQSLRLQDILALAAILSPEQVELIEEPFPATDPAWQTYAGPFALAMDESLWNLRPGAPMLSPWVSKLVLKPARLGLSGSIAWLQTLKDPAQDAVLSSCYESGWSLAILLQMSAYFHLQAALGFGTYDYLQEDVLVERLNLSPGKVHLPLQLPCLNKSCLKPYPGVWGGLSHESQL